MTDATLERKRRRRQMQQGERMDATGIPPARFVSGGEANTELKMRKSSGIIDGRMEILFDNSWGTLEKDEGRPHGPPSGNSPKSRLCSMGRRRTGRGRRRRCN